MDGGLVPAFNNTLTNDTLDTFRLLSTALQDQGYETRNVPRGKLALNSVHAAHPDLILLDIVMPDKSGYGVCKILKANPKTRSIPIIFMSALHETFDKVKVFRLGGVDYITKPFQMEEVLARIQVQLELSFAQDQILQLNAGLEQRVQQRAAELDLPDMDGIELKFSITYNVMQPLKRHISKSHQPEP